LPPELFPPEPPPPEPFPPKPFPPEPPPPPGGHGHPVSGPEIAVTVTVTVLTVAEGQVIVTGTTAV
jgi:hypothetical protein